MEKENLVNQKSTKAAQFGCDPVDYAHESSEWYEVPDNYASYIECQDQKLVLMGNRMVRVIQKAPKQTDSALITLNNADLTCLISNFYACSLNSTKGGTFLFKGRGEHKIINAEFNFCGIQGGPDQDCSVIYIEGNSTNEFNTVIFNTWEKGSPYGPLPCIASIRAIWIRGSASLQYDNPRAYNHTATKWGGFMRIDTTGLVIINGGGFDLPIKYCCDRAGIAGAIYKGSGSTNLTRIQNVHFFNCGPTTTAQSDYTACIYIDGNNFEFVKNEMSFNNGDQWYKPVPCLAIFIEYPIYALIQENTIFDCTRGIKVGGKAVPDKFTNENIHIDQNTFRGLTDNVEGAAIEATFIKERSTFDGNTFTSIHGNKSWVKVQVSGITTTNYTVSKEHFSNYATNNDGNVLDIQFSQDIKLVLNNCKFTGNQAGRNGGALHVNRPIAFVDCIFTNNRASQKGGAVSLQLTTGCSFENCIFTGNTASTGGCIYVSAPTTRADNTNDLTIVGCTFNESTGGEAHCIYFDKINAQLTVTDCHFINNKYNSSFESGSCILSLASETVVKDSHFSADNNQESCGGINVTRKSSLTVTGCSFTKMNAGKPEGGGGGGIAYSGLVDDNSAEESITITSCVFTDNTGINGVAMLLQPTSTIPAISSCTIQDHRLTHAILSIFFQYDTDNSDFPLNDMKFYRNSHNNSENFDMGATGIWIAESQNLATYQVACHIIFTRCEFISNSAPSYGGAFGYGGSERPWGIELTFDNCDFLYNECNKGYGGALRIMTQKPVSIINCTFNGNIARGATSSVNAGGGAITFGSTVPSITILECDFQNCSASQASFIYSDGEAKTVTISHCTFSNLPTLQKNSISIQLPSATNHPFTFESNKFIGLRCEGSDGSSGLHLITNSNCEIRNCTFQNCEFEINNKHETGMLAVSGDSDHILTVDSCTFQITDDSITSDSARAIYVRNEHGLQVVNCIFQSFLTTTRTGAALRSDSQTKSIPFYNCTFQNVKAYSLIHFEHCQEIDVELCQFISIKTNCAQGIIYNAKVKTYSLTSCIFNDCGGLYQGYQEINSGAIGVYSSAENVTIFNCTFDTCQTIPPPGKTPNGGAINIIGGNLKSVLISQCRFLKCRISGEGLAVYIGSSKHTELRDNIFENSVANTSVNNDAQAKFAVYVDKADELLYQNNSILETGDFFGNGSGLCCREAKSITIDSSLFSNLKRMYALRCISSDELIIENSTWDKISGGNSVCFFLDCTGSDPIFRNNTLKNHMLIDGSNEQYLGFMRGKTQSRVENCTFENNEARCQYGGGIGMWCPSKINYYINCTFKNNHAFCPVGTTDDGIGRGGAITLGGSLGNVKTIIQDCRFENNRADKEGGAISIKLNKEKNSICEITNCVFMNNQAARQDFGNSTSNRALGGSIHINGDGQVTISGCSFSSNSAHEDGHAIYSQGNAQVLITGKCTFRDNARIGGSQIAVSGTNFEFTDSTITLSTDSPRARAFTILSEGSIDLHNSTLHDMTAPSDGNGNAIYIKRGAGNVEIYNNIFRNCGFGATINKKDVSTIAAILCNGTNLDLHDNKFLYNMAGLGKRSPCLEIITTGNHHIHSNHFQNSAKAFIYRVLQKGDVEPDLIIEHNIFDNCYGTNPAAFFAESYHTFQFKDNNFTNHNPDWDHFYIIAIDFFANLDGDTFTLNHNYFGNNKGNDMYGGGSGIWIDNKAVPVYKLFTIRFENCIFENNHAKYNQYGNSRNGHNGHGGAFQIGWSESTSWVNLELDNCTFKGNQADNEGGAVSIQTTGTVQIENCVFENNRANVRDSKSKYCGGAIYFEPDFNWVTAHNVNDVERYCESIIIANCSFANNEAFNSSAIYCLGGIKNTTFTITDNCRFIDNGNTGCALTSGAKEFVMESSTIEYSKKKARGIETVGNTTLRNVRFINNQNSDGKGNALYIAKDSQAVEIYSCLFESCGSGKNETTIICESAPLIIDGTTINYSTTALGARAIEIRFYGNIQLTNNYFAHTSTDKDHGAIYYNPTVGTYTEENLVIENNTFDGCKGDNSRCFRIYLKTENIRFYGNTIQNCVGSGPLEYLGFIEGVNGILETFTFDHCIFNNCNTSSEYGGGSGLWVSNKGTFFDLIFESCIFSNNKALGGNGKYRQGYGGAIQYGWSATISKVSMRFSNCSFNKNWASRGGGAISLDIQHNVIIENCTFTENQASNSNTTEVCGGAIFINPNYGEGTLVEDHEVMDSITIVGCTFSRNFAYSGLGNAIYIPTAKTTNVFIKENCTFDRDCQTVESTTILISSKSLEIDNITVSYEPVSNARAIKADTYHARAIQTDSETVSILHSIFKKAGHNSGKGHAINLLESVQSADIDSCHFTDCAYTANSHAVIHSLTKDFTLSSSVIEFTQKTYFSRGLLVPYACTLNLNGVTFKGCGTTFTGFTGGALQYDGVSKVGYVEEITLEGCIFDNNSCPYASSIMITCGSIPTLKDCTISKNEGGWKFVLLFNEVLRQEVILEDWKFEDNYFINPGNTLDCGGCGLWIAPKEHSAGYRDTWPLTFQKCQWRRNRANQIGGAFAYGYSNTLRYVYVNITDCIFEDNTCDGEKGGALSFNSQVQVQITKSQFRGNEAKNGTHQGHALYVDTRCYALVYDCKFVDNSQSSTNSVIQVSGQRLDFVESEISFTTDKGCRGIFMNYAGILNCTNSSFFKCNAGSAWGGGIFFNLLTPSLIEEEISIIGCTFNGNIADNGCAMLLNTSTVPTLQDNQVYNQNNGKYILSIFFTSFQDICIIENMEFKNCVATSANDGGGSGIWIANQREFSKGRPAELIFRNCTWENNTTPNKGGALHYGDSDTLVGVELTFDHCNFINNQAKTTGGAVSLVTQSPIVFNECKFLNNRVTSNDSKTKARGSSIFIDCLPQSNHVDNCRHGIPTPLVSITGCTFTNETADDGNAIFVTSKIPACFISGCNFKNCGTTGTVVVLESQEILFQNNDIIFDKVDKACRGLEIRTISVTTITNSKFQKCRVVGSMKDKTTWGGGIYLNNTLESDEQEDFTMEYCTFDACEAPNGCAILLNVSSSPVIRETIVQNHRSDNYVFCIFCNVYFQDLFTIESCTFYNNKFTNTNKDDGGGSGIWISNDQYLLPGTQTKISFKGCNWTKNSGVYGGGFSYGTSKTVKNTELVFESCHFENNQATGDMGGALYLTTIQPIYIDNCTFINNKILNNIGKGEQALGGAISFDTNATTCTIIGSTFRKNTALNGHALYVSPTAPYVELIDSHFISNSNGNVGSQILHKGKEIHATNTGFEYETITLHARGVDILTKSKSYFTNCNFTLCETDGDGGGLHIAETPNSTNEEELTLDGCIFDRCTASNGCAVLAWLSSNPTIRRCTIKDIKKGSYIFSIFFTNFQEYVTVEECIFQDLSFHNHNASEYKDSGGCGLLIANRKELSNGTSTKLTFNKCNFINNYAWDVGGAISYGHSPTLNATSMQFVDCLFEGNAAGGSQGGALWFISEQPLTVSKCTFRNNKVNGKNSQGGHIYVDSKAEQVQISETTFDSATATTGTGIYSGDSTKVLRIYDVTFNNCGTQGSVISSNAQDFQLSSSKIIFTESAASKAARGVELLKKAKATILETEFINCHSTGPGAGIHVTFAGSENRNESLSIMGCIFDSCSGTNGCAMYLNLTDTPTINGNTIKNSKNGNYIISVFYSQYVKSSTVENCIFENNYLGHKTTPDGGGSGIWIAPEKHLANDEILYLTFKNCTFVGNSAFGSGGAFAYGVSTTVDNTALTFENSRFYSNNAGGDGGALYIITKQPLIITNCLFDNNTAINGGGALYIDTKNNVTIEHTQIARNSASQKSSGVYINNSYHLKLLNNTIATNTASSNNNLAASLSINNEGTATIDQCKFDFTRQTSQYQIELTGSSKGATLTFTKCCFTHDGVTDESLTHIISTVAGTLNIPDGNCFDSSEKASLRHSIDGTLNKGKSIFNCHECDDVYVPTIPPEPTPKATPAPTEQPTTSTSSATSSVTSPSSSATSPSSSATSVPSQISTSEFINETGTHETSEGGETSNKSAKIGMIAGIIIAILVLIAVIVIFIVLFVLRGRSLQQNSDSENASEMNDETISGITGIDATQDDPIWAGTTATQDNPLFNGGDDDDDQMITNDFEESWGDNVI